VGWKLHLLLKSPTVKLVEREPMWDGNEARCGLFMVRLCCVEREPMWDGNTGRRYLEIGSI